MTQGYIPNELIEEILDRTDIVALIESYIPLKRRGRNYVGLCPFHLEDTPSFSVSPEKQMFYCFGCQKGGSALTFVMEYEHLSFFEAAEKLAARAGVTLPEKQLSPGQQRARDEKRRLTEINELAAKYYREQLKHSAVALQYLEKRGIAWRNVAGYSTETVAQHTFALLFYLMEHLPYYDTYVKSGKYMDDVLFTHFEKAFHELNGKTWGIIGMGTIGRRVADIAGLFGCHVIYYSTTGKNQQKDYERADWDTLLTKSDIISVHAPLTDATLGLINAEAFAKMKRSAIFINVGRGPIVVEQDLYEALENGEIAAAGLDVLKEEPMSKENPLAKIKDSNKLLITPHIAWASVEARTRLMKIIEKQIKEFFHL